MNKKRNNTSASTWFCSNVDKKRRRQPAVNVTKETEHEEHVLIVGDTRYG